jgi:uncharacterized membrane protein HdeD (DUF308 family)
VAAQFILALLAVAFLAVAVWRVSRDGFRLHPASRTWLLIAAIFGAVSTWLWWSGPR